MPIIPSLRTTLNGVVGGGGIDLFKEREHNYAIYHEIYDGIHHDHVMYQTKSLGVYNMVYTIEYTLVFTMIHNMVYIMIYIHIYVIVYIVICI
jgi:hypothetical protein